MDAVKLRGQRRIDGGGKNRLALDRLNPDQQAISSATLSFFPLLHAGEAGVWNRELTSFLCAGIDNTCLHQTLIEALSPSKRRLQWDHGDVPCGLERYQCPHTVLFNGVAKR
jgi:hypothetical protein